MAPNKPSLERYLVGGAVRDQLLGRPVKDRDWVVVGSTPAEMRKRGFIQVGRDFPVYLHPRTREEHALARTERKRGQGHTGFQVNADPTVTLEEDLKRRDLTINAMARAYNGHLIDPYGGQDDLAAQCLRHVSPAFAEDPLRVLRVARFAAQLPGFDVADDTRVLMSDMVARGELQTLSAERVWGEAERALAAEAPARFFEVLDQCGGSSVWFPEVAAAGLAFLPGDSLSRYAQLPLDLDGFATLGRRIKAPRRFRQAAEDRVRFKPLLTSWQTLPSDVMCDTLLALAVPHGLERLQWLTEAFDDIPDAPALLELASGLGAVKLSEEEAADVSGEAFGVELNTRRREWLDAYFAALR